jgi:hypothetical protein
VIVTLQKEIEIDIEDFFDQYSVETLLNCITDSLQSQPFGISAKPYFKTEDIKNWAMAKFDLIERPND